MSTRVHAERAQSVPYRPLLLLAAGVVSRLARPRPQFQPAPGRGPNLRLPKDTEALVGRPWVR